MCVHSFCRYVDIIFRCYNNLYFFIYSFTDEIANPFLKKTKLICALNKKVSKY